MQDGLGYMGWHREVVTSQSSPTLTAPLVTGKQYGQVATCSLAKQTHEARGERARTQGTGFLHTQPPGKPSPPDNTRPRPPFPRLTRSRSRLVPIFRV
eukprot:scaffold64993_cov17-Tisochrysis_lutea.AAC.1